MKKLKWMLGAAAILAMSVALTGCGGDKQADNTKGGPTGNVMVYTSIYPDIIDNMCKPNVQKAFPNMKVSWFQGGTEKVVTKITGEIKANKIAADALMVADPSYYLKLDEQKLLMHYVSPEAKNVISDKDKDGAWTAVRISNMIIAYNSDKLKANDIRVEEGNSAIQNKLLTGEYAAAIILEENILKLANTKKEPLKVSYPTDGVIMVPSPIAIFEASANKDGAKALVDWWLSKEGQQAVVKGWMHSVRGDVPAPTGAPETKTLVENRVKVDWAKLANNNAEIKEEFRKRVMDK